MNLFGLFVIGVSFGIPRVSGDEPGDLESAFKDLQYSPRERG